MDARAVHDYAASLLWNTETRLLTAGVSAGVDVGTKTTVRDGWALVGRYAAGTKSAHVQACKMRRRHNNLEVQVRPVDNEEWKAEIWVRVKAA